MQFTRTAAMEVAGQEFLLQQRPCLIVCRDDFYHCNCKHCWCVVANDAAYVSSNELVVMSLLPCWHNSRNRQQSFDTAMSFIMESFLVLDQSSLVRQDVAPFMCRLTLLWSSWWYFVKKCRGKLLLVGQHVVIGMQQSDGSLQVHPFNLLEWCACGIVVHSYLGLESLFLILRYVGERIGPDQSLAASTHAHWHCCHLFLSPLLVGNVPVRPVCLLHAIHGCAEVGTLVHVILADLLFLWWLTLYWQCLQITYSFFCGLLPSVSHPTCCWQCNCISGFQQLYQSHQHCCLQGGFSVFCKLRWGEPDVFIAVRGHDYDWVVVVESLFDNQSNIVIVG